MLDPMSLGQLPAPEFNRLQELAEQFEEACQDGRFVELTPFLPPPEDPLRMLALHELIKTDLELGWRRGRGQELESYLAQYPELGTPATVPASLVYEEYLVRHAHGDRPPLDEYRRRFPNQFAHLQGRVDGRAPVVPTPRPEQQLSPTPGPHVLRRASRGEVLSVGGGYKLVECIGSGGFGEVWRAEAPGGIAVAVKIIIRPPDDADAQRELDALELARQLRHPFLLPLYACWVLEDRILIVMELADGSLRHRHQACQQAGLPGIPTPELLTYFRESAEALDYLHGQRVQHRDVKPDNILLLGRHAKLADFGLLRRGVTLGAVRTNGAGTPAYMAPEIWQGSAEAASDQYSLAASYAELRLQRVLFGSRDWAQVMHAHLNMAPPLAGLGPDEKEVVRRALAKDPVERFPSCLAFMKELEAAVAEDAARPPSSIHDRPTGRLPLPGEDDDSELGTLPQTSPPVVLVPPLPEAAAPEPLPPEQVNWLNGASAVATGDPEDIPDAIARAADPLPEPAPSRRWYALSGSAVVVAAAVLLSVGVGGLAWWQSRPGPQPVASAPPPAPPPEMAAKPPPPEPTAKAKPATKVSQPVGKVVIERDDDGDILPAVVVEAPEAVFYRQALASFRKRDYDAAINALTEAIRINGQFALAYKNRAYAHMKQLDWDKALADLNRAIELNPHFAKAYANRGRVYAIKGDYDTAVENLTQALVFDPTNTLYRTLRAAALLQSSLPDRMNRALGDVDRVIRAEPNNSDTAQAYILRGQICTARRQLDRAATAFERAQQLSPHFGPVYAGRAELHVARKEYVQAIADYTKALELNRSEAEARNYYAFRAEAYRLKGDLERAEQDLGQASGYLARTFLTRGLIHAARGRFAEAVAAYGEALRLEPENAEAYRSRAQAYRRMNRPAAAEADERKAAELDAPALAP
jgi:serine/threonine protein kinase/Flp pilus assembly protein TadD